MSKTRDQIKKEGDCAIANLHYAAKLVGRTTLRAEVRRAALSYLLEAETSIRKAISVMDWSAPDTRDPAAPQSGPGRAP